MSGYSETQNCPRCGSKDSLEASIDRNDVSGLCLECGYEYRTVTSVLTLEAVNEERKACNLEPLKELKSKGEGWVD